eukprot:TRINITY_DN3601_c0_g4_i4.p2 TRINITY_DN3601_c0_g4~~TRINITY_DN3601_c0_g4_i4.p2  ORF type:complete len:129 (+),score=2.71 TRINITY_DN3601_c0_g4_i4:1527-1913(+)
MNMKNITALKVRFGRCPSLSEVFFDLVECKRSLLAFELSVGSNLNYTSFSNLFDGLYQLTNVQTISLKISNAEQMPTFNLQKLNCFNSLTTLNLVLPDCQSLSDQDANSIFSSLPSFVSLQTLSLIHI